MNMNDVNADGPSTAFRFSSASLYKIPRRSVLLQLLLLLQKHVLLLFLSISAPSYHI